MCWALSSASLPTGQTGNSVLKKASWDSWVFVPGCRCGQVLLGKNRTCNSQVATARKILHVFGQLFYFLLAFISNISCSYSTLCILFSLPAENLVFNCVELTEASRELPPAFPLRLPDYFCRPCRHSSHLQLLLPT